MLFIPPQEVVLNRTGLSRSSLAREGSYADRVAQATGLHVVHEGLVAAGELPGVRQIEADPDVSGSAPTVESILALANELSTNNKAQLLGRLILDQ